MTKFDTLSQTLTLTHLTFLLFFLDPSIHFLAAQGEIAKIKEEIDRGMKVKKI